MKVEFKNSFLKELKKLKNKNLKKSIAECILQVEIADNISQIKHLKKLTGFDVYFRIRIGHYRIGLKIDNDIVYFVIFEHRKEIYRNFP